MEPQGQSKRKRKRVRRRPVNVLASVLTTFGLYCGIASIFAAIDAAVHGPAEYQKAAYFILAALVFDIMDGAVARMTNSVSEFGKELDSLTDMVSFGVAPAVLIYTAFMLEERSTGSLVAPAGSMIAIIYVISGGLRLARFNAYQSHDRKYFIGLPVPGAAAMVASLALFTQYFEWEVAFWVLGPLTLALAGLMVSEIRYPKKIGGLILAPRLAFRFLVAGAAGIAVFHYARLYSPAIVFLPIALGYVLFGICDELYGHIVNRESEEAGKGDPTSQEGPQASPFEASSGDTDLSK